MTHSVTLPQSLLQRLEGIHGKAACRRWNEAFPGILQACVQRWRLTELKTADEISYNMVLLCRSEIYGQAVLKLAIPNSEFLTEANALKQYNGRGICRLYGCSEEDSAMLLERIVPGRDLRSVKAFEQRIAIAAPILAKLPVALNDQERAKYPHYGQWVKAAFEKALNERRAPERFLSMVEKAGNIYSARQQKNSDKALLLHGDLHHMNILQGPKGFVAIDPKGAVGELPMNGSRFIENELDLFWREEPYSRQEEALRHMVAAFSHAFGCSGEAVWDYLYVDCVLSTCWTVEDNSPQEELEEQLERCTFIDRFV